MVSSDNVPHVIYIHDLATDEIRYINRQGGVWGTPETVHTENNIIVAKAVIDGTNRIHIVFYRGTARYISGVSGSWDVAEVADAASAWRVDIAVNNSNEPVIVFDDGLNIYIRYKTGGVWQAADVVNAINNWPQWTANVAVDAVGDYHVAWQNEEDFLPFNYEVYYKKKEGGVWLARQELASNVQEWYTGIGLDDEDNAYVLYQLDTGAPEVVYYRKVTNGVILGAETVFDATMLRPNNDSSVFAFLYHKYPTKGVLPAALQPVVALLDEVPIGFPYANIFLYAARPIVFSPTVQTLPATEIT